MTDFNEIVSKSEIYVRKMFAENPRENLIYHNLKHTEQVVDHVYEISSHTDIDPLSRAKTIIAAWFHDTGHLFVEPARHEMKSVELFRDFVKSFDPENDFTESICDCILSTKSPRSPKNLMQEIMCDADTYHLGTKDFKKTNKDLKKENRLRNLDSLVEEWDKNSLIFLEKHVFYTSYCLNLLTEGKQRNMRALKKKASSVEDINVKNNLIMEPEKTAEDKNKNNLISKGIQTMLRLTSSNHLDLSQMADSKANILISVNAIIISVILSVLLRKIETERYLAIPTIFFLASSMATIIIAILATRPNITNGRFIKEDIVNKKTNLLFFGNFHTSTLDDYMWGMSNMMRDPDYLYGALIQDIHQLGVVLGKKYRLVRLAYNVFMIGLTISVVTFIVATLMNTNTHKEVFIQNATTNPLK
jgi:predicted metal-dependent HD superfamily phosphohydrolase